MIGIGLKIILPTGWAAFSDQSQSLVLFVWSKINFYPFMTHILATFHTIIQQREKHANLPVPSPPNSPPFDFDGRNFLRSSSALTFSQRWKNANKAKGNFIEVKLLPSVRPSIRFSKNCLFFLVQIKFTSVHD